MPEVDFMTGARVGGLIASLVAGAWASAAMAQTPTLVSAYTQGLVSQCGGALTPALETSVIQRIDLNGDKLDDYVIDAGRYPCPSRPAAFAEAGNQVTIFIGAAEGRALPAFQRVAFGSRLEGRPETGYSLWLTLGGSDCGETSAKARCDRRVVWRPTTHRFELAEPDAKSASAVKANK